MQRVHEVQTIDLSLVKSKPPGVLVVAHGLVPTTGWTSPNLSAWFYIRPPDDGIQDFDFSAQEPKGLVGEVVLPVAAELTIHRDPASYWGPDKPLRGVRVHARSNVQEAALDLGRPPKSALAPLSLQIENGLPSIFGPLDPPKMPDEVSKLLIGKEVRVYKTGDMLSMDLRPNRLNIELSPADRTIVSVWFG